jgi:hypothetical protein
MYTLDVRHIVHKEENIPVLCTKMIEIKVIFSFWYLVQHAAGNPGGTKTAIHVCAAH